MMKQRWLRPAFILSTTLATHCFGAAAGAQSVAPNSRRCPATAPADGGACTRPGLRCGYRPCMTINTQQFTCVASTRRWRLVESSCNPPMPPPPIVAPPVAPLIRNPPPPPVVVPSRNPPALPPPVIIRHGNPPPPRRTAPTPLPIADRNTTR